MEVYFKKEWGFIHYKITAIDRKTLNFEKEIYSTSHNSDLLEIADFINFNIDIKSCKSKEKAQLKFKIFYSLYTDKINNYLKIEDSNGAIDFIQEKL